MKCHHGVEVRPKQRVTDACADCFLEIYPRGKVALKASEDARNAPSPPDVAMPLSCSLPLRIVIEVTSSHEHTPRAAPQPPSESRDGWLVVGSYQLRPYFCLGCDCLYCAGVRRATDKGTVYRWGGEPLVGHPSASWFVQDIRVHDQRHQEGDRDKG